MKLRKLFWFHMIFLIAQTCIVGLYALTPTKMGATAYILSVWYVLAVEVTYRLMQRERN